MKVEVKLFMVLAVFFAPVGVIYGTFTHWREPVGTTALLLSSLLGLMVAFYLRMTARKLDERPEDNPAAHIHEQEGEYGFFSPHSWWPLPLAFSAAVCFAGLAIGWWLFIIGATLGVVALVGWTFEYFKGPHAI